MQLGHDAVVDRLAVGPQALKPLPHFGHIAAVGDRIIQLGVAAETARRKVGAADNGNAGGGFPAGVADIGFGVEAFFEVGADFHFAAGNQGGQGFDGGGAGILLGLEGGAAAYIAHGFVPDGDFLSAAQGGGGGGRFRRPIAGGDFLLGRPVGAANQDAYQSVPVG